MKLYFIALIPPEPVLDEVRRLKLEMKDRFGASHALKAPAHITLQMPFRKPENEEGNLIEALSSVAVASEPFNLKLSGFDCFAPRVMFIRVMPHEPVQELYHRLGNVMVKENLIPENRISDTIHPHMTIATRDLAEAEFNRAWPEFKNRSYEKSFSVESLTLLKHNGKHWDPYRSFSFSV